MWVYNSPIGQIAIVKRDGGLYDMLYNGVIWESCSTPEAQASNVYEQVTGCADWDMYDASRISIPRDLTEWDYIPD